MWSFDSYKWSFVRQSHFSGFPKEKERSMSVCTRYVSCVCGFTTVSRAISRASWLLSPPTLCSFRNSVNSLMPHWSRRMLRVVCLLTPEGWVSSETWLPARGYQVSKLADRWMGRTLHVTVLSTLPKEEGWELAVVRHVLVATEGGWGCLYITDHGNSC